MEIESTETSGHLIDNCSDLEINPTEIGGQITDHNDQTINNDDCKYGYYPGSYIGFSVPLYS